MLGPAQRIQRWSTRGRHSTYDVAAGAEGAGTPKPSPPGTTAGVPPAPLPLPLTPTPPAIEPATAPEAAPTATAPVVAPPPPPPLTLLPGLPPPEPPAAADVMGAGAARGAGDAGRTVFGASKTLGEATTEVAGTLDGTGDAGGGEVRLCRDKTSYPGRGRGPSREGPSRGVCV